MTNVGKEQTLVSKAKHHNKKTYRQGMSLRGVVSTICLIATWNEITTLGVYAQLTVNIMMVYHTATLQRILQTAVVRHNTNWCVSTRERRYKPRSFPAGLGERGKSNIFCVYRNTTAETCWLCCRSGSKRRTCVSYVRAITTILTQTTGHQNLEYILYICTAGKRCQVV